MTAHALPLAGIADSTTAAARKARQGLAIYFPVLIVGSGILEWLIVRNTGPIQNAGRLVFFLMWMPALSSLVARIALREGIGDVSFRFGGVDSLRAIGIAVLMPLTVGAVSYGLAWATGLVGFSVPAVSAPMLARFPWLAPVAGLASTPRFFALLALFATFFAARSCVSAAGEEIGWRGYMLTRLVAAGVPRPLFVSGLIWGSWHLPLILSGVYAAGPHPLASAGLFMVDVMGIALVIGILRLRTGSVWPAVALHGAWNSIIQGGFDPSSAGPGAPVWVGESGVIVSIVSLAFGTAVYLWWKGHGSRTVTL